MFSSIKEAFINILTMEFLNHNINSGEGNQNIKITTTSTAPAIIETSW
jgi:hypothetical protein